MAAAGAALGLADDLLNFHRAPRFEQLLRERPPEAPGSVWDRPVVPRDEIGESLPEIESGDVDALVFWSAVTVFALLVVSGLGPLGDVLRDTAFLPVVVAVVAAATARLVAGGELASFDAFREDRIGRATAVMVANDWAGRLRPAFGAAGVESHYAVRAGVPRARALLDTGAAVAVALIVHAALLAVLLLATLVVGADGGTWPRYGVLLVLGVLAMSCAGIVMAPARVRRLPCTLGRSTIDRLREGWEQAPISTVRVALCAVLLPLIHGLVVVAGVGAFGGSGSVIPILFVTVLALAVGALAPVPEGFFATDAVLVLGLSLSGVVPVTAVATVLLWRVLMTWLPMLPGLIATRRLLERGLL
jgi:uncharacterized membrane protein YbhN (UPF0104 family)